MMNYFFTFCYYYSILSVIGIVLVLFRDDRYVLYKDLIKCFYNPLYIQVMHVVLIYLFMPLTIPFSIVRILRKWF